MSDSQIVRVGVAAIVRKRGCILMGLRKGSHGKGCWSFPGGHLEFGEGIFEAASRELKEETGIEIPPNRFHDVCYTNNIFNEENKHSVTIVVESDFFIKDKCEPIVMEPTKCECWEWCKSPPSPLFSPIQQLLIKYPNLFGNL